LNGEDLRAPPLGERKTRLAWKRPPLGIALNDYTDELGAAVFRHACRMGLEGIVSKRLTAPYRSGRKGGLFHDVGSIQGIDEQNGKKVNRINDRERTPLRICASSLAGGGAVKQASGTKYPHKLQAGIPPCHELWVRWPGEDRLGS
jgi:hypothetical protein